MSDIQLAMACDDSYALPLAVAVRSLLENLQPSWRVELTVVDAGISCENKIRCELAWQPFAIKVHWVCPDVRLLADVPVTAALPVATYFRLLLPELRPDLSKILYLDPDVLVLRSIHALWMTNLGDHPLAAAQDLACPFVHFRTAMPNFALARRYLLGCDPIPNYAELKLPAELAYFNAGVMLLNLDLWRSEALGRQLIDFTRRHAEHNVSADQYSLNAMVASRRLAIDVRWNQLQAIYNFPGWQESPFSAQQFRQIRDQSWIAHFAGPGKPWESGHRHPQRDYFFEVLDRTPWAKWRPAVQTIPWSRRARRGWRTGRNWVGARVRRWQHPVASDLAKAG